MHGKKKERREKLVEWTDLNFFYFQVFHIPIVAKRRDTLAYLLPPRAIHRLYKEEASRQNDVGFETRSPDQSMGSTGHGPGRSLRGSIRYQPQAAAEQQPRQQHGGHTSAFRRAVIRYNVGMWSAFPTADPG